MSDADALTRPMAAATAALLAQGRTIDGASRSLTAAAAVVLMVLPAVAERPHLLLMTILSVVLLAGLAEVYLAVRVGFDAALFRQLADAPDGPDLPALDTALVQLALLPPAKAGRPSGPRIAGALRLLRHQALIVIVQSCLILVGAVAAVAR